ncbi:cobaltochelatase subunit CobN [Methanosphaera sp.]
MKNKIFSLCMIIFVLLICTTVTASDINNDTTTVEATVSDSGITTIDQETIDTVTSSTSETKELNNTTTSIVSDTTKTYTTKDESSVTTKTEENNTITTNINSNILKTMSATLKADTDSTYNIQGKVTCVYDKTTGSYVGGEEDAIGVANATIRVYNEKGKLLNTVRSDSNGNYTVKGLSAGIYDMEFEYGTYAIGDETVHIINSTQTMDYVFIPDIAIISYSGSSSDGQKNKVDALKTLSNRVYFLESYNLNSSYDVSDEWMLDYANFILVDMYSLGNGFGVDTDLIKNSPASQNEMVAYTFGIYGSLVQSLGWGYVGGNPYSVENTYVGSYWQAEAITNETIVNTNMKNLFDYILYLLGESNVNPTTNGNIPLLSGPQWGIYYPGFNIEVPRPTSSQIKYWIESDPGYDNDGSGSLNWMTDYYNPWVLEHQNPTDVLNTFEQWYNKNVNLTGPFVAILSYYQTTDEVEALIEEFEKQGRATFCLYQYATTSPTMTELLDIAVTDKNGLSRGISAASSLYSWSTSYSEMQTNVTVTTYEHANITILNALSGISKYSYESEYGPQAEWTYKVTIPQFEGVIGALPISYVDDDGTTIIIQEGVEKHVQLVNGWANLKEKENANKKIAIVVYDYPPGKANIGASYLDVYTSVHDLLVKMAEEGYDIGMSVDEIPTTEELTTQIIDIGNKGNWAQGLLESYVEDNLADLTKYHQLISASEFDKMYNELPSNLQEQLIACWGTGLGNGSMIYNNSSLVIPGIYFGNIFITIQPARGWDSVTDYHSDTLAPPQQYIAFYKYLYQYYLGIKGNSVDGIVSMGTHGTLEWLPGRTLGLQSSDWPFQLIETPIIYPYIVSNPGEGMTAKERSFAQVITHMTPVTTAATLYGEYSQLETAITNYESNKKLGDSSNIAYYKEVILNITSTNSSFATPTFSKMSQNIELYWYGVDIGDVDIIEMSKSAILNLSQSLNKSMLSYYNYTIKSNIPFSEYLELMYNYTTSEAAFEAWLSTIHETLESMSGDTITYGVHTLGYIWNDTEMVQGITTIASSRTNVLQDIMTLYYNIDGDYYKKIKDISFTEYQTAIETTLQNIVTRLVEDTSLENVAQIAAEQNQDTNSSFYSDLVQIKSFIDGVRDNREWQSIMTALSGGYVISGLSGEPALSDVLPTGRSMYSSDTTKMPSKAAWNSAVESIDQLLIKYMTDLGEDTYPELVGEIIWGTEVLRTEGVSLAQFLYLLGVKPTWDQSGKVNGTEIIPLEELTLTIDGTVYQRPRIDVFATIVSNNPYWLSLLYEATNKVNALNESVNDNYVKKHYAEFNSTYRLFGLNGAKLEGTGVSDLLNNIASWQNSTDGVSYEAATVYESRLSNAWTINSEGQIVVISGQNELFAYLLSNVDLVIQDLDSTWRYLDSDDYTDWFGGLLNAANVHGATPNTMLLDIRNRNNVITSTISQEVSREVRTTITNPQWLQTMTSSVGGWNQLAQNYENLIKSIFTTQGYEEDENGKAIHRTTSGNSTGLISQELFETTVNTLVYSEYLVADANYKSYSIQSMTGWAMTLAMNNYWKTSNTQLLKDLIQKYVDAANKYGVACCHHTCGNVNLHEWILTTGSAYGVKGLERYSQQYYSATKTGTVLGTGSSGTGNGSGEGGSGSDNDDGGNGTTDISGASFGTFKDQGNLAGQGSYNSGSTGASQTQSTISEMTGSSSGNGNGNGGSTGGSGSGTGNGTGSGSGSGNGDGNGNSTNSGDSALGQSASSSSEGSAGGSAASSGAASATGAVYEVSAKNGGEAASSQAEIALGYILAIVLIAMIFFLGFTRRSAREE